MSRSESAQAKWRRIIAEQQTSGLTVAAFCRERSLPQSSLFMWKRRLGNQLKRNPAASSFVAVRAMKEDQDVGAGSMASIELCLGHGRRLVVHRGFDRQLLLALIAALEGKPSVLEDSST